MIALNELIAPSAPTAFSDGVVRLPAGMPQFGQPPTPDAGRKVKTRQPARLIEVRASGVHGHGVYAAKKISRDARIIEYTGERVSWENASADPENPHTFLFGLENGKDVIDGEINGNEARWINHSCSSGPSMVPRHCGLPQWHAYSFSSASVRGSSTSKA